MSKEEKVFKIDTATEPMNFTFTQAAVEIFLSFLEKTDNLGNYVNNVIDPKQHSRFARYFDDPGNPNVYEVMKMIFKEHSIERVIDNSFTWASCRYPAAITRQDLMQKYWQSLDGQWKIIWEKWYRTVREGVYK